MLSLQIIDLKYTYFDDFPEDVTSFFLIVLWMVLEF